MLAPRYGTSRPSGEVYCVSIKLKQGVPSEARRYRLVVTERSRPVVSGKCGWFRSNAGDFGEMRVISEKCGCGVSGLRVISIKCEYIIRDPTI